MSVKDKLEKMRRIYIIANTPSRATDWMISQGFLEEGYWRDPRVVILANRDQLVGLGEFTDVHYQFLDKWREGHSQDFIQLLWHRLPGIMRKEASR